MTQQIERTEFCFIFPDVQVKKNIISAIQTLVEEVTFELWSDSLRFRAMDPSHVGLIDMKLDSSFFQKWSYEQEKPTKYTVRVEDYMKILNTAKKGQRPVEVSLDRKQDALRVIIRGEYDKDFRLHLIESSTHDTPLPMLTFGAGFSLPPQRMSNGESILNDLNTVANHVTIAGKNGEVVFKGKGDTGRLDITLSARDQRQLLSAYLTDSRSIEAVQSTYSIEYLSKWFKALSAFGQDSVVLCEFDNKMPLRVTLNLADPTKAVAPDQTKSYLAFYLAPRVQE